MDNQTKADELLQDKLHALIDGQVNDAEKAQVLAFLAENPAQQEALRSWKDQRDALRALHETVLDEPIPDTLLAAARLGQQGRQQLDRWWRWGGMAAAVMLAFGLGWMSRGELQIRGNRAAMPTLAFAHQASLAHAVYSPEVRHPVEVTAAQQEHLVQWLSKRVGKPLKIPVLASLGYELVGGRLLPGEGGARAQFMFQNPAGLRITLYLGSVEVNSQAAGTTASRTSSAETAFRYSNDGPAPSFYWVDQGFGYALTGKVPREDLMRLAELVYQQL